MAKVEMVPTKAGECIQVKRLSSKHISLWLCGYTIHFWDNKPVAVLSGGCVWYHAPAEGAVTKMIASVEPLDAPRIRADASQFDFTLGQVLTSAGLPLTRTEK